MISLKQFSSAAIDKSHAIPLYFQLKETLLSLIQNGEFREGDLIPTEGEIGEQFQVSRITVRRAISELAREGYLISRQGKGTFVARPKIERPMSRMKSFSQAMVAQGHNPGSRLLSLRHEKAGEYLALALDIHHSDRIWIVDRLRLIDDEPIGISTIYLNLPLHLSLSPAELEQEISLWSILERKGLNLSKSEETIEAIAASESQAELLQVEVGAPLLLVEGTVYDDQARPVEYHKMFHRGDRYKYTIQTVQ
ncbi:MAG: GntR family transcriptional regulator [Chloroflexota bacterium]